ncbi:acyltransferase [Novosphingobium sp. TCA1]|uniref:acyltransferase family protein n=1 Tax=Novosphingobium sp. TCA1 TaxID=2682474 RepID=UPI001309CCEA|nr:acyltransferase [Novosphingobium sp. TCA1]GFE73337.1 exopolysaccharide production protein ExoZ [Novosphingobium sp. TCA1]
MIGEGTIGFRASPLAGLQIARALAAVCVVLHHALETSGGMPGSFSPDWLTTAGAGGVDVFFVISGFIMAHTCFGASSGNTRTMPSAAAFLQRRAIRIYPLYWLACLAMLSLMAMGFLRSRVLSFGDVLTALALMPGGQPIIGVAWTLVYEMYFYLVFALCLLAQSRKAALVGMGVTLAAMPLLALGLPSSSLRDFLTDPIPLEFLMGLGLAWLYPTLKARLCGTWPAAMLVLFGLILMHGAPLLVPHDNTHGLEGVARVATWGVAGLAIVAGLLAMPDLKGQLTRMAVALGDASYALYLSHAFVLMGYGLLLRHDAVAGIPQYLLVVPVVLLACLVGLAVHALVERPLLKLGGQFIRRASSGGPASQLPSRDAGAAA